jgi:biopolymer transport protein ExbD
MAKFEVPDTNDSPDLTPMIDVVFLLIVFFMVVAKQVSEQYVELSDPSSALPQMPKFPSHLHLAPLFLWMTILRWVK